MKWFIPLLFLCAPIYASSVDLNVSGGFAASDEPTLAGASFTGPITTVSSITAIGGIASGFVQQADNYLMQSTGTYSGSSSPQTLLYNDGYVLSVKAANDGGGEAQLWNVASSSPPAIISQTTFYQNGATYAANNHPTGADWLAPTLAVVVMNSSVTWTGELWALLDISSRTSIQQVLYSTAGFAGMPTIGTVDGTRQGFQSVRCGGSVCYGMGYSATAGAWGIFVTDWHDHMNPVYKGVITGNAYQLHMAMNSDRLLIGSDVTGVTGLRQWSLVPDVFTPRELARLPASGEIPSEFEGLAVSNQTAWGMGWSDKKLYKIDLSGAQQRIIKSAALTNAPYGAFYVHKSGNVLGVSVQNPGTGTNQFFLVDADTLQDLGADPYTGYVTAMVADGGGNVYLGVYDYTKGLIRMQYPRTTVTALDAGGISADFIRAKNNMEVDNILYVNRAGVFGNGGIKNMGPSTAVYSLSISSSPLASAMTFRGKATEAELKVSTPTAKGDVWYDTTNDEYVRSTGTVTCFDYAKIDDKTAVPTGW